MIIQSSSLHAALLALLLAPACAWADGDADPQTNDEIQGKWVLVTNTSTPSSTAPATINRRFVDPIFGIVRRTETSSGTASGARPVSLTIQANTWSNNANGSSVANAGSASLTDVVTWEWQPTIAPIENKDVLMAIGGTATGTVSVGISGNDGTDGASASVAFDAAGSGSVGGEEIIGMITQPRKKLEASAFISASEASSKWAIDGKYKKTKGGGSVSGDAETQESQTFQGEPTQSKSIAISAAITATGNTNNVKVYGFTLAQGLSGSVAASNSAFDNATSTISSSTNFVMSSN